MTSGAPSSVLLPAVLLPAVLLSSVAFLDPLPAHAQHVSIPVTNGNFAVTNNAGTIQYSTPVTLLSPIGTINITASPSAPYVSSPAGSITTDTPTGVVLINLSGSTSLNDGRTASFTTGVARLETLATVTGAFSVTANADSFQQIVAGSLPAGATVSFSVKSGALDVPRTDLSSYPTPQVAIPITGGSYVINDAVGAGPATLTIQSLLTPMGTTNLTISQPSLTKLSGNPWIDITGTSQSAQINGIANGTVTFTDGKKATISDRLITLEGTAQLTAGSGGSLYRFTAEPPVSATTITGNFTGGSISVPATAISLPPTPLVVSPTIVLSLPIAPPKPKPFTFVLGFAPGVNLRKSYEFLHWVEKGNKIKLKQVKKQERVFDDDRLEVEISALEISRIHPGLRCRD